MSRSLKVASENLQHVKLAVKRKGFPSQHSFATELGLSLSTIKSYLNGKPVDFMNFVEMSEKLGLDWQDIADLQESIKIPESVKKRQDWGDAPDISIFYGRSEELTTLETWIIENKCRLVAIVGMGGIGKTALSAKLADKIQDNFDSIIWKSLRESPSVDKIVEDLIKFLADQQEIDIPNSLNEKITQLIQHLRNSRYLLVLDNAESILQAGTNTGQYQPNYEGYGHLFRRIGESLHNSCLIVTSREKPAEIALLEGDAFPVRCLQLTGLKSEAQKIFIAKGLEGSEDQMNQLIELCYGSPMALKLVATSIKQLFADSISAFLSQGTPVVGGISRLLDEQFNRLPELEKSLLYWLAIEREAVSMPELQQDIIPTPTVSDLLNALNTLKERSLIEAGADGFTLHPVILEYMSDKLIDQMIQEIESGEPKLFNTHCLIKATAKDYIRNSQTRLILQPIAERLLTQFASEQNLAEKLREILNRQRNESVLQAVKPGYTGSNSLHLLQHIKADFSKYDFSRLAIWQAYLAGKNLANINFAYSELKNCVFIEYLGGILTLAFSPDGNLLATGDTDGNVCIWNVENHQLLQIYDCGSSWVRSVAFSPDGTLLASGSEDPKIRLWNVATGRLFKILPKHSAQANKYWSVAFNNDGKCLASGSEDGIVRIWDIEEGKCFKTLKEHDGNVFSVAFSLDGEFVASGGDDKTVKLWDVYDASCLQTFQGHREKVSSVAFSQDSQWIASGSDDTNIILWNIQTGKSIPLKGHNDKVISVAFSPNNKILASTSDDKTVRLWKIETGERLGVLRDHNREVKTVAFHPDSNRLASGSFDQAIRLWNVNTNLCLYTWHGFSNAVESIDFHPDGKRLVSGSFDGLIRIWDIETGKCLKTLEGHTDGIRSVALSTDGKLLGSGGFDQTVKIWNIETGQCLKTLMEHKDWVRSVAFSSNDQFLASGSHDRTIKIWDISTGECVKTFKDHHDKVRSVYFLPDNKLVSGSHDTTVKIWEIKTDKCYTLQGHQSWVWTVAYNHEKEILASGSHDQTVRFWDIKSGNQLGELLQQEEVNFWSINFSPDGQLLATGSNDGKVRLWEVETRQLIQTLAGHKEAIWSVVFSHDGKLLASASQDGSIQIWEVEKLKLSTTIVLPLPYQNMNIREITGLSDAQKTTLKNFGAIEK